jgi:hypothetical protein
MAMIKGLFIWLVASLYLVALHVAMAADVPHFGFRSGLVTQNDVGDFTQFEIFMVQPLPWVWQWSSGWRLSTFLTASAGVLESEDRSGFIGTLGPEFKLSPAGRLSFIIGSVSTFLGNHEFGKTDLGGLFQFTSYIGLNYRMGKSGSLGYRIQHMSNAGIFDTNPGLDMHVLQLDYRY